MNLIFRLIKTVLLAFFRERLGPLFAPSILHFRVWPNDLDTNFHMNNGRYLTLMDLGRFDLVMRNGLLKLVMRNKSVPVLSAATIRYRLSLDPFQKFRLESRVLCWDETWVYMEQRFIFAKGPKKGVVAAIGLVKGGFLNKKERRVMPTKDILAHLGMETKSPPFPAHVKSWVEAEEHLKDVTAIKKAA